MRKILVITIPLLVLILLLMILIKPKLPFFSSELTASPAPTAPITSLTSLPISTSRFLGTIEQIDGQTLTVKGQPLFDFALSAPYLANLSRPANQPLKLSPT